MDLYARDKKAIGCADGAKRGSGDLPRHDAALPGRAGARRSKEKYYHEPSVKKTAPCWGGRDAMWIQLEPEEVEKRGLDYVREQITHYAKIDEGVAAKYRAASVEKRLLDRVWTFFGPRVGMIASGITATRGGNSRGV